MSLTNLALRQAKSRLCHIRLSRFAKCALQVHRRWFLLNCCFSLPWNLVGLMIELRLHL